MKALWLGPIEQEKELKANKYHSAAANVWQLDFIENILKNDYSVENISITINPFWPKGKLFPRSKTVNNKIFVQRRVPYLNLPLLRILTISFKISFILIQDRNSYEKIFSYNSESYYIIPNLIAIFLLKKEWITIQADDQLKLISNKVIYLSQYYFNLSNHKKKKLFPGIVKEINFTGQRINRTKRLVYTGSQSSLTEIFDFAMSFNQLKDSNWELRIIGHITDKRILKLNKNPKIHVLGFLDNNSLTDELLNADAFLNCRSNNHNANLSFPSKLLLYSSYSKPIISPNIESINRRYFDNIYFLSNYDSESILRTLNEISKNPKSTPFNYENQKKLVRETKTFIR